MPARSPSWWRTSCRRRRATRPAPPSWWTAACCSWRPRPTASTPPELAGVASPAMGTHEALVAEVRALRAEVAALRRERDEAAAPRTAPLSRRRLLGLAGGALTGGAFLAAAGGSPVGA